MNIYRVSSFVVAVKQFEGRFAVRQGISAAAFHHRLVLLGRHIQIHILPRVHRGIAVEHFVVQVRTCALAGGAHCTYLVAAAHRSADRHAYLGQVGVARAVAEAVVDYDFVAVAGELEVGLHHHAVAGCVYRSAGRTGEVLAVVEAGAAVNRVDAAAEGARQVERTLFRHYGRNSRDVRNHVASGEGHPLHFVEKHALQVRTLHQVVGAAHRRAQSRVSAFGLQRLVAAGSAKRGGTRIGGLRRETVDGTVHAVVAVLDSFQGSLVKIQLTVQHRELGLPFGSFPFEAGRFRQIPAENRGEEPEVEPAQTHHRNHRQHYAGRAVPAGSFVDLVLESDRIVNIVRHVENAYLTKIRIICVIL